MSHLEFRLTADGSKTIYNALVGEHYHSHHGALQEALHVFVAGGTTHYLTQHQATELSILEVGFGTGLNFLLTADHCQQQGVSLSYTGIEAYPVDRDMMSDTGYATHLQEPLLYQHLCDQYTLDREARNSIRYGQASLELFRSPVLDFHTSEKFDIVYFDAFASVHQPEMWSHEVLAYVCSFLKDKGIFVTYSVTGNLKRSLKQLGFSIERPPGAAGKREMMRATKLSHV